MPQIVSVSDAFRVITDGKVAQTIDATPVVIYSHPVDVHKVAGVEVYVACFEHTMSAGAVARIEGLFHRIAGDLVRTVAPRVDPIVSTFANPQPGLTLIANTATQSIDVQATGKAATTLRWHVDLRIRETA